MKLMVPTDKGKRVVFGESDSHKLWVWFPDDYDPEDGVCPTVLLRVVSKADPNMNELTDDLLDLRVDLLPDGRISERYYRKPSLKTERDDGHEFRLINILREEGDD